MSKRDQSSVKVSDFRRSPGISYQKLLDQDSRPVPDHLRIDTAVYLGDHDIPVDRYIDPKFHELEKEEDLEKSLAGGVAGGTDPERGRCGRL